MFGLHANARRRQGGLSREQVAAVAGISADWYGRLEGGLESSPSRATLLELSRALRLTNVETRFVFDLAGFAEPRSFEPPDESGAEADDLSDEVLDYLVADPSRVGIYVLDAYLTPSKWNVIADAMWRFSSLDTPVERNFIYRLADPYIVSLMGPGYESAARYFTGMFRRAHTCRPTPLSDYLLEMALREPIFRRFWDEHVISEQVWASSGPYSRQHPIVGSLWINTMSLSLSPARDQVVAAISPADVASAKKFDRLRALGITLRPSQ